MLNKIANGTGLWSNLADATMEGFAMLAGKPKSRMVGRLRHLVLLAQCTLVLSIAVAAICGWVIGYSGVFSFAFRQSVPMHPSTALLLIVAVISLYLSFRKHSALNRRMGMQCAAIMVIAGLVRIVIHVAGDGQTLDQLLFPSMNGTGMMPVRFTMAPVTSLSLILIGLALFCQHYYHGKQRLTVYILTLMPALIALLAISRCLFLNMASQGSQLPTFPMALSAAVAILAIASGIAGELLFSSSTDGTSGPRGKGDSLRNKIAIGFGAAVFMLCGVGIFSYQSIAEFINDSHWDNHTYQVLGVIDRLYANFKDAESSERGFIITGDASFLTSRQTAVDGINPALMSLEELTKDNPERQRQITRLRPLVREKLSAIESLTAERRAHGFDGARLMLASGSAVLAMSQIHAALIEISSAESTLLARRMRDTETNARRGIVLICLSASVALMMVLAAGWLLNRDIGGRERAETALRSSESLFRGLLQSAPDALIITNEEGEIQLVNTRTQTLFGYENAELIGKPIQAIVPGGIEQTCCETENITSAGLRKDGTRFPAEISHCPVNTPDGIRVTSVIRDVTRQKEEELRLEFLNSALSESNLQLGAANTELESFSYSVSHDLRAPLRSIDGFSQAILEDYSEKLDDEGKDHLNRVRAATQRMGHLIDDLLNLSRLSRAGITKEQVDLSNIAKEIGDELKCANPAQSVELIIENQIVANTDARLIRIVLTNLLNNAWKFSARKEHARVEFGCVGANGSTEYFVKDNGAGFDPAYSSKLFGAFQRLHSATEYAGTGIGLATVQRIVRRHGGKIWADGKPDEGATFRFTL